MLFFKKEQLKISIPVGSFQIYQIHVKSKNFKFLKYLPSDSLIENRKFQKFELLSPSGSDFMAISMIFPAEFEGKM